MIFLLFIPSFAHSEVTVNVNQTDKYIEITVCNNIEKRQIIYRGISVEKKEDERWRFVKGNVDCPCSAKCRRVPVKLDVDKCKMHRWDKKKTRCETVEKGTYRFVIHGSRNANKTNIIGKSREFKVY